jgi:bacterioferritin (cytochrome b1)
MGNQEEIRDLTLRKLLKDNFTSSRHFRKFMEAVEDASLKHYFRNLASRRSQFAIEIAEEIIFYGGKRPFSPSSSYQRENNESCKERKIKCLKKALRINKNTLQSYQESLCRIHDGSCREVLLRHKAHIEKTVFELKALKRLLKYSTSKDGQLNEIGSHS